MRRLILSLVLSIFAMLNMAFADDLSIQITREIKFANGFGQIEAKPILKNVSKDIKVMGDYNVDEKSGNVIMKIDKVLYGGKIYDLSESFSTKRRLKNVKTAVLKSKAKIKLSGGSHPELLAIFNDENTSGKKADGKNGSGSIILLQVIAPILQAVVAIAEALAIIAEAMAQAVAHHNIHIMVMVAALTVAIQAINQVLQPIPMVIVKAPRFEMVWLMSIHLSMAFAPKRQSQNLMCIKNKILPPVLIRQTMKIWQYP